MALYLRLFLLTIISMVVITSAQQQCQTSAPELNALRDLYHATNGDYWFNNTNWLVGDPCQPGFVWEGLACSSCSIFNMNLYHNNLTGTIPESVANLTMLDFFDLAFNNLHGSIPPSITTMTSLEFLYLYSNSLSGKIPKEIGNLTRLYNIVLSDNKLSSNMPPSMGFLENVNYVWLDGNQLDGTIPRTFGKLNKATSFIWSFNQISGTIPQEIGELESLSVLFINQNEFSGKLPQFLQQPPPVSFSFNASLNQFDCPLPDWCASPPTGNGLCAPCVDDTPTNSTKYCCRYAEASDPACKDPTAGGGCYTDGCPIIDGLTLCSQSETSSCLKCIKPTTLIDHDGRKAVGSSTVISQAPLVPRTPEQIHFALEEYHRQRRKCKHRHCR